MINNKEEVFMLTTLDNPYNPFTNFDEWYEFDVLHGYNSCAYLSRIANTSIELSETDFKAVLDQAIDEIVSMNIYGNYIKVTRESWKNRSALSQEKT